jgi:hypothetical protein
VAALKVVQEERNERLAPTLKLIEASAGGGVPDRTRGRRSQEQPVVEPQVSHFRQVPLRISVKFEHSGQECKLCRLTRCESSFRTTRPSPRRCVCSSSRATERG